MNAVIRPTRVSPIDTDLRPLCSFFIEFAEPVTIEEVSLLIRRSCAAIVGDCVVEGPMPIRVVTSPGSVPEEGYRGCVWMRDGLPLFTVGSTSVSSASWEALSTIESVTPARMRDMATMFVGVRLALERLVSDV
jgi:hypothetical protein